MSVTKRTSSLAFVALAAATMWFWLGGCDFSAVDEGARVSASAHAAALNTATNPSDAEHAIRQLMTKIGATSERRPGVDVTAYFGFALTDKAIKDLAVAQARYNSGDTGAGASVTKVYNALSDRMRVEVRGVSDVALDGVPVELVDALVALRASAKRALTNPERPENAALVALVSDHSGVADDVAVFDTQKLLSPVQVFLFGAWLHNNAQRIPAFSFDEETSFKVEGSENGRGKYENRNQNVHGSCPAGQVLLAKYEWKGGGYEYEKGLGPNAVDIVSGTTSKVEWASPHKVHTIVVKAATNFDYHEYETGITSGEFSKSDKFDISNIQFCGGDDPDDPSTDCFETCENQLVAALSLCALNGDGQGCEAAAREAARLCNQGCHDQGQAGPNGTAD